MTSSAPPAHEASAASSEAKELTFTTISKELPTTFFWRVQRFPREYPTPPLHPKEVDDESRSQARAREFALGRASARTLLELRLQRKESPLPRLPSGEVAWPAGVRGSISHARAGDSLLVASAVTNDSSLVGIGIDVEPQQRKVEYGVIRKLCTATEQRWIDSGDVTTPPLQRLLMLFAAKEALFKALYPTVRDYVGFKEVILSWEGSRSAFLPQLLPALAAKVRGAFVLPVWVTVEQDIVLAFAAVRLGL